jgi:acetyl esterase/lipase
MSSMVEDRSVLSRAAPPPDITVQYGSHEQGIADVRYGTADADNRPLVIVIHGGFWRPAFDRLHTGPMCAAIASAGWTVASIEYRRIPGNPDATVHDVELAVAKLPKLVKRHGGKAVVTGHSAGGHLALWTAAKTTSDGLIGALGLGPIADLQYAFANVLGDNAVGNFLGACASDRPDIDPCKLPSPSLAVTIVHGVQDAIAPIAMSENYLARHPETRLVKVDNCGHFAVIDPASNAWPVVIDELNKLSNS